MRLWFAALVALAAVSFPSLATAEFTSFSKTNFEARVKSNAPVVVHTHEWWCTTCRAQANVLESLQKDPKFAKVTMFRASPGGDRDTLAPMKAASRSIILVFAGGKEIGRLDWVTDEAKIRAMIEQAVARAGG